MKNLGIYIHIPFCESKCYYCDFVSFCKSSEDKNKYLYSLLNEIEFKSKELRDYLIDTIFIGGGTPSCMLKGAYVEIFNKLRMSLNISSDCEITIEANPNSITEEFLSEIKQCGINRISIGLQSSNDNLLRQINRIHTKDDFISSIRLIKDYDFKNINVDIMIGLPSQSIQDVIESIELVKDNVTHISCYGLILEENTKLYDMVNNKKCVLPSEEECNKMYETAYKRLKSYGFKRYEVSNFCKTGFECKHNLKYWNRHEYIGFGLNASSFINCERYSNEINFNKYIIDYSKISSVKDIKLNYEKLNQTDIINEFIMLQIRTKYGINLKTLKDNYSYDLLLCKKSQINNLLKNDLIKIENNCIKATDTGFYILNQIILELLCD